MVICVLLATIIIPSLKKEPEPGNLYRQKIELENVWRLMSIYKNEHGAMPSTLLDAEFPKDVLSNIRYPVKWKVYEGTQVIACSDKTKVGNDSWVWLELLDDGRIIKVGEVGSK